MKVIFLDIDGVLMTWGEARTWMHIGNERFQAFKPKAVQNLNRIIAETGAKIVISSTWRRVSRMSHKNLLKHFKNQGIVGDVIGITPHLQKCVNGIWVAKTRGDEIQAWLDKNPVDVFVIIDDDSDMDSLTYSLVHVKNGMENGLTSEQADMAINHLNLNS